MDAFYIAGKYLVHLSNDPASRKELAQRLQSKLKFKGRQMSVEILLICAHAAART
jgi:hypothetical protein